MSLTVFIAVCVLGLDFLLYVLFQWTYAGPAASDGEEIGGASGGDAGRKDAAVCGAFAEGWAGDAGAIAAGESPDGGSGLRAWERVEVAVCGRRPRALRNGK